MQNISQFWNPKQALLKQALKVDEIDEAKSLLFELHSFVHMAEVYDMKYASYLDELIEDLNENSVYCMPTEKDETIAWIIWHLTRIEDITVNILISNSAQILNDEWLHKLHTKVKDTGNAMNDDEIIYFSKEVNFKELLNYRKSVGRQTKQIIEDLKSEDLKRKFSTNQINRILNEGGVIEHPKSKWLLDYWFKKNVSGIILMPITRHQIVHLNDCKKLKLKCNKLTNN